MKIKCSVLIGSIVVAISILVATIYLSHIHKQKEQIDKVKVNSVCYLQHIFHNHGAFFKAVSATISPKNCWFL